MCICENVSRCAVSSAVQWVIAICFYLHSFSLQWCHFPPTSINCCLRLLSLFSNLASTSDFLHLFPVVSGWAMWYVYTCNCMKSLPEANESNGLMIILKVFERYLTHTNSQMPVSRWLFFLNCQKIKFLHYFRSTLLFLPLPSPQ